MDAFTFFDHRLNMVDPHRHGYHDRGEKVDGRLQYSYNARLATNHKLKVIQNQNSSSEPLLATTQLDRTTTELLLYTGTATNSKNFITNFIIRSLSSRSTLNTLKAIQTRGLCTAMRLSKGRAGIADTTATAGRPPATVTAWLRYSHSVDRRISECYQTNFRSGNMPITTDG